MAALACPLHSENGSKSVEQKTGRELWRVISQCVMNENDARLYQPCLKQITSLLEEDEASDLCQWYTEFWNGVGNHCPTIAATHLEEFLRFTIDRHDSSLFRLLCVGVTVLPRRPNLIHCCLLSVIVRQRISVLPRSAE